jgi:hypothetical protein
VPVIACQVRLQRVSGIPQDVVINTFHFFSPANPTPSELVALAGRLSDFYNGQTGAGPQVRAYLNGSIAVSGQPLHVIKMYNLNDVKPRAPIYSGLMTMNVVGAAGLPSEVALCLSLKANPISGVSAGRLRGRIFIGPLTQSATTIPISNGEYRPGTQVVNAVLDAGERLMNGVGPTWEVWSTVDLVSRPIRQIYVDDAWDTQRRRGIPPFVRTVRNSSQV